MKKQLQQLLGKKYTVTGSDRKMEVTDATVQGYNPERNVALIEVRNGKLMVNVYRGYYYKPAEYVEAKDVGEVKSLIESRKKEKNNG